MHVQQARWDGATDVPRFPDARLVMAMGARDLMSPERIQEIQEAHPEAHVVGCSGAGEIMDTEVRDDGIVLTAVHLERAHVQGSVIDLEDGEDSRRAGRRVVESLPKDDLVHVLVLSDGLRVNGTLLVEGMQDGLPDGVTVTGGLAGDGARFERTVVAAEGRVDVRVASDGDAVVAEVTDTGIGIDEGDLHRLFQPFSQMDDTMHRTQAGTGLGLYICKGLVEAGGGTLEASSPGKGQGSTFRPRLPAGM